MSLSQIPNRGAFIVTVAAASLVAMVGRASSQAAPALWGTVLHSRSGSGTFTQSGDRILLYNSGGWLGPFFTNDAGVYAIYNIPSGSYALHVIVNKVDKLTRQVSSPAHLEPIVLES
jgi:hypothetical protein